MRSSDGWSALQSMYSPKASLVKFSCAGGALPSSARRRPWSSCSRMASWSDSGMPSSMPIVRIGM